MASGPARDVDLQLARGRPTLPAERFLTPAEALGEDVVAELALLDDQVLQLDLLVANADLTIKHLQPMDSVAFRAFKKYESEHREEHWAVAPTVKGRFYCLDDVPRDVPRSDVRQVSEAIIYPLIHMRLLGWWLAHAWRFIDLARTAIKSLDSWNVTTAAIASRALIEEVSCVLYEADEISKRWSETKSSLADDRDQTVHELLGDRLLEFDYASKGLGHDWPKPAVNVLTYVQKFAKRSGGDYGKVLETLYDQLTNAAHPAILARMAYSSSPSLHETGAYELRLLSRRPPAAAHSTDWGAEIASLAADATTILGPRAGVCCTRRCLWLTTSVSPRDRDC
jgi:hypothetical protein